MAISNPCVVTQPPHLCLYQFIFSACEGPLPFIKHLLHALAIVLDSGERGFLRDHSTRTEDPSALDYSTPWGLYVRAGWSMFTGIGTEKGRLPEFCPEAPTSTILFYISTADDFMSQQVPKIPEPGPRELFVAETEKGQPSDHVPYAIAKMYESATQYRYVGCVIHLRLSQSPPRGNIILGAVSNGLRWKFITLHLNENGKGGGYKVSPTVTIESEPKYPFHVISPRPDIVAAILAHWVRHFLLSQWCMLTNMPQAPRCYSGLDKNDWFVKE